MQVGSMDELFCSIPTTIVVGLQNSSSYLTFDCTGQKLLYYNLNNIFNFNLFYSEKNIGDNNILFFLFKK